MLARMGEWWTHHWLGCKLVKPLWKSVWRRFLKELKIEPQ